MSAPASDRTSLPQELCDLVLDDLALSNLDSKDARLSDLKACSLVSKGWRMRAAGHLFKSITLPSPAFSEVKWTTKDDNMLSTEQEAELAMQAMVKLRDAVQPGGILSSTSNIVFYVRHITLNFLSSIDILEKALPLLQQIPFAPNQLRGIALDKVILIPSFLSYLSSLLLNNNDSIERLSFHELVLTTHGFSKGLSLIDELAMISNIFPPLPNLEHLYIRDINLDHALESGTSQDYNDSLTTDISARLPRPSPKAITLDIDADLGAFLLGEFLFSPDRAVFDLADTEELNLTHYEYELNAHSRVLLGAEASLRKFSIRVCKKAGAHRSHFYAPSRDTIRRDTEIINHLHRKAPNLTHVAAFLELQYYRTEQFIRGLPEIKNLQSLQAVDIRVEAIVADGSKTESDANWDLVKSRLTQLDESLEKLSLETVSDSFMEIGVVITVKEASLELSKSIVDSCFSRMKSRSSPRFRLVTL
ncbi:hypothetical protein VKT23_011702 [Stygiomarasmius scandens]|uniref:F-box domain-containing protein n=1 Tax=Marasmiellus scandens TaxID=2682957 RepID=A0ABR1J7T9_9AGAR